LFSPGHQPPLHGDDGRLVDGVQVAVAHHQVDWKEQGVHVAGGRKQGDQIGRIFVQWTIVYFGQFYDNYKSRPHFLPFFPQYRLFIEFDQKRFGPNFGRFFTNSSGHSGRKLTETGADFTKFHNFTKSRQIIMDTWQAIIMKR
jgi:hypothetical protein